MTIVNLMKDFRKLTEMKQSKSNKDHQNIAFGVTLVPVNAASMNIWRTESSKALQNYMYVQSRDIRE